MRDKILTKDEILSARDLVTEKVEVPEWGGTVIVRTMCGKERDAYELQIITARTTNAKLNLQNLRAKLIAMTAVDEKGERLFTEKDVEALGQKSAKALDAVFSVSQKLNALRPKDINELTKNFEAALSEDSDSD